jgi:hypothetical protein
MATQTLTTPGTGPVTVDDPINNLFVPDNSGTGTVTVSGINIGCNSLTHQRERAFNVSAP